MLNKFGKSGVCPILVGLKKSDYTGPMKQLQLTEIDSEIDLRRLLATINKKCSSPLAPDLLEKIIDKVWPELQENIRESVKKSHETRPAVAVRSLEDKVDEILNLTRSIANAEVEVVSMDKYLWARALEPVLMEAPNRRALLNSVLPSLIEREHSSRLQEFDATHETRMKRFEDEFGSLIAIRRSDGARGRIADFAKKEGKLYWVKFEDQHDNAQRCSPGEVEILRPHE